jgi:signal transduction histidine kinase
MLEELAQGMFDAAGKLERLMGVATDITDRKKTEEKLKELTETLEVKVAERTAVAERRARDLRRLAGELSETEHRERTRLADLLHDDLQQLLTAARFRLPVLLKAPADQLEQHVGKIEELLAACLQASRNLSLELSPPVLRQGTLLEAIAWLADWFEEKHNFSVALTAEDELPSAPEPIRLFLFRAIRELLFNAVKHSGQCAARVEVRFRQGCLAVRVDDDGQNFDPAVVRRYLETPRSFGLFNVRERLAALDGRLEITNSPRGGASFRLSVPLEAQRYDFSPGRLT